jgi:hypothetical protein
VFRELKFSDTNNLPSVGVGILDRRLISLHVVLVPTSTAVIVIPTGPDDRAW